MKKDKEKIVMTIDKELNNPIYTKEGLNEFIKQQKKKKNNEKRF